MRLDHHSRIVQVLAKPGPEGKEFGVSTGFAITQSRILASGHAVRGAKQLKARFVEKQSDWQDLEQIWPSRPGAAVDPDASTDPAIIEGCDAAILEINPTRVGEILGSKLEPLLGYASPMDHEPWCSRGLLRAAVRLDPGGRPIWGAEDFGGTLYRADAGGVMSLDVGVSPEDAVDWQGASGSPVFVADQLVAIVRSWSSKWGGKRLKATWAGQLWAIPEFCKAAGLQSEHLTLTELKERVSKILNKPANRLLAAELAKACQLDKLGGDQVVQHLCGIGSLELLRRANRLSEQLLDWEITDDEDIALLLAEALERVVEALLPWGTHPELLEKLRCSERDRAPLGLLLPCASMSVAEILLAWLDRRPTGYGKALMQGGIAVGVLCSPFDPHVGFGANPRERTRQLLAQLGLEHGFSVSDMAHSDLDVPARLVNEALEERARSRPGRSPYLLFHRTEDEKPVELLARLLPALRICRIQPDHPASKEASLCVQLKEFATLKARRDELQKQRKAST